MDYFEVLKRILFLSYYLWNFIMFMQMYITGKINLNYNLTPTITDNVIFPINRSITNH